MCKSHARKHFIQQNFIFLLKFGHFTSKVRNCNYVNTLETIILVTAINKCLTKYFKNVKESQITK